jgi:5,10-methylene-tetrahydrofolate dehydrogenase/methenyl tetrahydrofolate cyclohydrolase
MHSLSFVESLLTSWISSQLYTDCLIVQNFTPDVKDKASIFVPAIGKMTIVVLIRNLIQLARAHDARRERESRSL